MKFLYSDDPIIACSTCSLAHAAIAVIRISGFKSLSQFDSFFEKKLSGPIEPRKVFYTKLHYDGQVIDDLCLIYFEGPKSYNGENILELMVHGNTLNTERIINLFVDKAGCRQAAPGEFTYRALKNKKLNLSQVEGLDLFLNANSGYALDQGLSLLNGNLHERYLEIHELFLIHKSSLELSIDFSDDVGESTANEYFKKSFHNLFEKFKSLYKHVQPLDHNLVQPQIVLAGLPNSGKSSLFNFLLSEERAIVSSIAGTTRDYLSETLLIDGVKYKLLDTAGIRESNDLIEAEGINRTKNLMKQSFFSILLINPFQIVEGFSELINNDFDLIFFTHADVKGFEDAKKTLIQKYPKLGPTGAVNLINLTQDWEKNLLREVNNKYLKYVSGKPILLERHKHLISEGYAQALAYQSLIASETDVAILSHELNTLGHCISELIGIISPEQVLNSIFSNFCIGK